MKIYQIAYRASKVDSNVKKLFKVYIKTDKSLEELKKHLVSIFIEDAANKLKVEEYEVDIDRNIKVTIFDESLVHETHGLPSIVVEVTSELSKLDNKRYGSDTMFVFPFNVKTSEILKHVTKLANDHSTNVVNDSIKITKTRVISHSILEV